MRPVVVAGTVVVAALSAWAWLAERELTHALACAYLAGAVDVAAERGAEDDVAVRSASDCEPWLGAILDAQRTLIPADQS